MTTRPAIFTPITLTDLRQAIAWIASDDRSAAATLRDAAIKAAAKIGSNPAIGAKRPQLASGRFRFLLLRGFSYVVVYAADTDPPRILRVLHTACDLPSILSSLD